MKQGLECGALIQGEKKKTSAHLNYCNEVLIDSGRKEEPTETAL